MNKITTEKLFYIMDYSSNYYRVDSKDQLVVVGNENEATIFSFADANRRIGAGPKSKFYFMTPVEENDEEQEEVQMDEVGQRNELEEAVTEAVVSVVKELKEAEISKAVEASGDEYDLASIDWEGYLTNFAYIASNINGYKDELNQKLAEVDKKICDVLHYIELCDTDEADAQDLVELLR